MTSADSINRVTLGEELAATGEWVAWNGGKGTLAAKGVFDGATLSLEFSLDSGVTPHAVADTALTADGNYNFELPACLLRAVIADEGANTDIDVYAKAI